MASSLKEMKKCGIKKVELICFQNCDCCSDLKNKELPIDAVPEMPRKDCPIHKCFGRYGAIVEFL